MLLARIGDGSAATAPTDPPDRRLLFDAARRQLVREVIRPSLDAGTIVVCARFADSTMAYQGYGAGVDRDPRTLAAIATDGLTPDLTILLDLPVEAGLARKAPGDVTRFEAEFDLDFHRRVRQGFLAMATQEPDRFVVIDATASIDQVARAISGSVDARLARAGSASEPNGGAVRIHT